MLKHIVSGGEIITSIVAGNVYAQQETWPPRDWNDTVTLYSFSRGPWPHPYHNYRSVIFLKNGDTINGNIRLGDQFFYFLKVNDFVPAAVRFRDIRRIKIWDGIPDSTSYERYNIGYRNLFLRKIGEKNDVRIFDRGGWRQYPLIEPFIPPLILVVKNVHKPIKICSDFNRFIHGNKNREPILKFINKRYHVALKLQDFKGEREMIDYILNAESKKLKGNSSE